jgi:hypothetical protein
MIRGADIVMQSSRILGQNHAIVVPETEQNVLKSEHFLNRVDLRHMSGYPTYRT